MVFFRNQRLIVVPGAVTKFSTEEKITFTASNGSFKISLYLQAADINRLKYFC